MTEFKNTWGLYSWFPDGDVTLIHPDDIEKAKEFPPLGVVFHCIGYDDGYLMLKFGNHEYRVRPSLYRTVPAPEFNVGDKVKVKSKENEIGIIFGISWHFKNKAH